MLRGTLVALLNEDDWAFVIKVHAVVEAALNSLIATHIGRSELHRFVERLGLRGQTGKLKLAEDLGLIDKAHVRFVEELVKVRNYFAHDVAAIGMTLSAYIDGLPVNEVQGLVGSLYRHLNATKAGEQPNSDDLGYLRENIKPLLWLSSLHSVLLDDTGHFQAEVARLKAEVATAPTAKPESAFTQADLIGPAKQAPTA